MRKSWLKHRLLFLTLGSLALVVATIAFFLKSRSRGQGVVYQTQVLESEIVNPGIRVSGTLRNQSYYPLYATESGTVTKIFVKSGDQVKAGQILAALDASEDDIRLEEQAARLAAAAAKGIDLKKEAMILKELSRKPAGMESDDIMRLKLQSMQSTNEYFRFLSNLDSFRERLKGKIVRAPRSGVVAELNWMVGDRIDAGRQNYPGFGLTSQDAPAIVALEIPPEIADQVVIGSEVYINSPLSTEEPSRGVLRSVDQAVFSDTRRTFVRAEAVMDLSFDQLKKRSGLRVFAEIKGRPLGDGVWVPRIAFDFKVPESQIKDTLDLTLKKEEQIKRVPASETAGVIVKDNSILTQNANQGSLSEVSTREMYVQSSPGHIVRVLVNAGEGSARYVFVGAPELKGLKVITGVESQ